MVDIYVEILRIVDGNHEKATAIKKIVDENITEQFEKLLIDYKRECENG